MSLSIYAAFDFYNIFILKNRKNENDYTEIKDPKKKNNEKNNDRKKITHTQIEIKKVQHIQAEERTKALKQEDKHTVNEHIKLEFTIKSDSLKHSRKKILNEKIRKKYKKYQQQQQKLYKNEQ